MKKVLAIGLIVIVVLSLFSVAVSAQGRGSAPGRGGASGGSNGPGNTDPGTGLPAPSVDPLDDSEVEALLMALDDEYKALATYEAVMDKFGDIRPFSNIAKAEEQHIAALVELFERYDIAIPANTYLGNIDLSEYDDVSELCAIGVQAEVDNAGLYDQLLAMTDNADLTQVLESLQRASQEQHLPAFERCAG